MKKKLSFIQKHGGYIIDYAFCIFSIWAVVDYFYHGGVGRDTIQVAFVLTALYAFVVTRRILYLRNLYLKRMKELEDQIESLINVA